MQERAREAAARRLNWWLAGVAAAAAALVLARQFSYGVGLGGDWADYLGTARNLIAGKGFLSFDDLPYEYWPPLYPLLLAAAGGWFLDPFAVAGPLNAVALGLAVFLAGRLLRPHVAPASLVVWACAALAVAPPLGGVAAKAIGEPVFVLCVTAALALACRSLETCARGDHRMSLLVGAATVAALAVLTRYIGICVVLVVAPLLFVAGKVPLTVRAGRALLYIAIGLTPVGLWLLRNHLLLGASYGPSTRSELAFAEIVWAYCAQIANWVFLDRLEGWLLNAGAACIGACLLALAISVAVVAARWWRTRGDMPPIGLAYCVFGGFAVVYLVAVAAAQTVVALVPLGGRYLVPAYPPLLISLVLAGEMLRRWWAGAALPGALAHGLRTRLRMAPRVVAPLLVVWLAGAAMVSANRIWAANSDGIGLGLAGPKWRTSATLEYVRRELRHRRFHTNNAGAVYAHTAHENYGMLERKLEPAKRQIRRLPEGAHIVIMCTWSYDYTDAELRAWDWLAPVAELDDGVVFRVARNPQPTPRRPALKRKGARRPGATEWCW